MELEEYDDSFWEWFINWYGKNMYLNPQNPAFRSNPAQNLDSPANPQIRM